MRRLLAASLAVCIAVLAGPAAARTQLTVYTTYLTEHLATFKSAFESEHPDIEIVWHRDSTGTLTARLVAEAARPRADVIFGLAASSMLDFARRGMLETYAPRDLAMLKPSFRDAADPPAWIGMSAWVAAVCFNRVEAAKAGLARPTSWWDLADPRYKGRISMPDPASSGSGFITVSAWLQVLGEAKGWELMERIHPNVAVYEKSGTKPCAQAAAGEHALGISHDLAAAQLAAQGGPLDIVVLKEGGGWEMDAAGIVKGTARIAAARRLLDWTASRRANELYAGIVNIVARTDVPPARADYPAAVAASMIRNDLQWAADNRDRILAEWQRRFEKR